MQIFTVMCNFNFNFENYEKCETILFNILMCEASLTKVESQFSCAINLKPIYVPVSIYIHSEY